MRPRMARYLASAQWLLAYGVVGVALGAMEIAELIEATVAWAVGTLDRSACRAADWGRVK